jgi:hypothetical protein
MVVPDFENMAFANSRECSDIYVAERNTKRSPVEIIRTHYPVSRDGDMRYLFEYRYLEALSVESVKIRGCCCL